MKNEANKTQATPGPRWTADDCHGANGFITIRPWDGTLHGDTGVNPIATVYEVAHADLIAAAPQMREALEAALLQLMLIQTVNSTRAIRKGEVDSSVTLRALDAALRAVRGEE